MLTAATSAGAAGAAHQDGRGGGQPEGVHLLSGQPQPCIRARLCARRCRQPGRNGGCGQGRRHAAASARSVGATRQGAEGGQAAATSGGGRRRGAKTDLKDARSLSESCMSRRRPTCEASQLENATGRPGRWRPSRASLLACSGAVSVLAVSAESLPAQKISLAQRGQAAGERLAASAAFAAAPCCQKRAGTVLGRCKCVGEPLGETHAAAATAAASAGSAAPLPAAAEEGVSKRGATHSSWTCCLPANSLASATRHLGRPPRRPIPSTARRAP